jgi:hypothetical protein
MAVNSIKSLGRKASSSLMHRIGPSSSSFPYSRIEFEMHYTHPNRMLVFFPSSSSRRQKKKRRVGWLHTSSSPTKPKGSLSLSSSFYPKTSSLIMTNLIPTRQEIDPSSPQPTSLRVLFIAIFFLCFGE